MSEPRWSELPRVFVSHSLSGLGATDPLLPLQQSADCEVWSGVGLIRPDDLVNGARGCAGLLCLLTDRIDENLLDACPELRVISSMSVGVDHIDLDAASLATRRRMALWPSTTSSSARKGGGAPLPHRASAAQLTGAALQPVK